MPRRMVRVVSSRGHGQPSMVFPSSTLLGSAGTPPLPLAGVRSAAPELKAQPAGGLLHFKRLPRMAGSGQFAAPGFSAKTSGTVPCEARLKSSDRKSCEAAPRLGLVDAYVKAGERLGAPPRVTPYARPPVVRSEAATTVRAKRLPRQFATHAARRFTKAEAKAEELLDELPPEVLILATGGGQIPLDEARELVRCVFLVKGGPEGGTTHKGLRAWRSLQAEAARYGHEASGLPASKGLVAHVVRSELARAMAASSGSQGGRTVGTTFRDGFLFLEEVGLPIDAKGLLVEAASQQTGPRVARPRSHAGSFPIGVYCQVEHVASGPPSAMRTIARSIVMTAANHCVRLNDSLNAKLFADAFDPSGVMRGTTAVASKDGLPLEMYAPACGWLGPIRWVAEHLLDLEGREHAMPDYYSKPAGTPSSPGTVLLSGVASPDRARSALRDILSQPPLCMSKVEFDALNITTHSWHGTLPDMIRFLAAHGLPVGRRFTEADARAAGHWLRDKNAPQPDARMVPGAPGRGVPDGAPIARGGMSFRYTQGEGRLGEREEQLQLRTSFYVCVQEALRRVPGGWHTLPKSLDSWDILRPSEPEEL